MLDCCFEVILELKKGEMMGVNNIIGPGLRAPVSTTSAKDLKVNTVVNALSHGQTIDFDKLKSIGPGYAAYVVLQGDKVIYAGSSNHLAARFSNMMMPKTTFLLYNKLVQDLGSFRSATNFLMRDCKYRVKMCESRPDAEAVEQLTIATHNPVYNKR